mgnify:FL=1
MDQVKIGRFIAECRREKNLTQMQLAEKLNITDRAVSKWENGRAMPDSSIMIELCSVLGINVNELLSGERIEMENYNKVAEENLLTLKKQKEESDKRLLNIEVIMGIISIIMYLIMVMIVSFSNMQDSTRVLIIMILTVFVFIECLLALRIEQQVGYYECRKCHHKYVPTYSNVLWAMHINRTRYMKCPKCQKRSWQKKVLTK